MQLLNDTQRYDKKTPREHVLLRPDTYIGNIEQVTEDTWIYDENIIKKNITYVPGLYKIYDEILINARDASINDPTCNIIKINCNMEDGSISVYNNGNDGIPIEIHPIHNILIPYMIFGELLTGSNYDDNVERITGGRNGLGATCANIFSKEFIVEIHDSKRCKSYKQIWKNNMSIVEEPIISKIPKKNKSFIKVTFYPDYERFGLTSLDKDHFDLFYKRAYDIAGTSLNKLDIYFNDKKLKVSSFKQYINLYYPDEKLIYNDENNRWLIGVIYIEDPTVISSDVISFVNGIYTKSGTHVNYIVDNIVKILYNDYLKKKDKDIKIQLTTIKENFIFFINSTIINPSFSSQTKENLTTKIDKFGSKYEFSLLFIKKIAKTGVIERLLEIAKNKSKENLKKTDGKKQLTISGIPKLEDANKAGTKDSNKCTLILTEGDSAKATAMSGLAVIGKDYYGVFPLKGKLLNVRDASTQQLLSNEEIKSLKIILGLKQNEDYSIDSNYNNLRYGKILLLTDSDCDGSHIKGLFINLIHSIWPTLIYRNNFIVSLNTPIVKAFKNNISISFYNLIDYNNWKDTNNTNTFKIKYYKGLGTSTSNEAKEYFTDIDSKLIYYNYNDTSDDKAIELAFDKTKSDDRKEWLMNYDINNILLYDEKIISYTDFVHKDLKHFSNEDLIRSIPSVIDGLKPSQRKILYGAFLRGLDKDEVKVAQLAGFVSDRAAYHHGETSLMGAIIGLAQNFVGSNNINILKPLGQFGTRMKGGKDYASPRYIWTMFETLTTHIFSPLDNMILNEQYDDGIKIEPEYYIPIIPMILINGTEGIGTGFSTKIPPYNPIDIIANIKNLLHNKPLLNITPWWNGFKGKINCVGDNTYEIYGNWHIEKNKLIITELPIGEWTYSYKDFLEKLLEQSKSNSSKKKKSNNGFQSYTNNNTDVSVYFELLFDNDYFDNYNKQENKEDLATYIEKTFKLCKKYSTNNMHLYSPQGQIKKYISINDIIIDYYKVRHGAYIKRKDHMLNILSYQLQILSFKVKFIMMIVNNELIINNKKKQLIEDDLEKLEFPKFSTHYTDTKISYDYLLAMPIYSFTKEKIEELINKRNEKESEYNILKNKSIEQIWEEELNLLEIEYTKFIDNYMNSINNTESTKTTKSKSIKNIRNKK